jgi:hypothetical protein
MQQSQYVKLVTKITATIKIIDDIVTTIHASVDELSFLDLISLIDTKVQIV